MRKIDIHTHILPKEIPHFKETFGYGGFIRLQECPGCTDLDMVDDNGKFFRRIQKNCFDPETRLNEIQRFEIDVQVLSTVPVMFSYWAKPKDGLIVSRFLNDHLAEVVKKNPRNFIGLGTIPLQDPDLACREAERCINELGLTGFQIGSHINNWNLSDPNLYSFYQTCEQLNAPLFVHPWDMMGKEKMPQYWLPWLVGMPAETSLAICSMIFGGIFEKFPRLRVAFAHGGGSFPFTLGRIQHGFDVRPDLCATDSKLAPKDAIGKFFVDSLVHDPKALDFLIELFGKDKICLGTDYPFPLGDLELGTLIENGNYDQNTKDWLLYKSAIAWLGMKETDFKG